MKRFAFAVAFVLVLAGCRGGGHSHDEGDHDHGGGAAAEELPGQAVTLWSGHHELFMEHDPLIAGREVGFAAHVTLVPSFRAATAGRVTVRVTHTDGSAIEGSADGPKSPGIFRPAIVPKTPGACRMEVVIETEGTPDRLTVPGCEVFASAKAAVEKLGGEEEGGGTVPFLKEQQWKTDFAMKRAEVRELQPGVRASGEIRAVPGKEARLSSPGDGRVQFGEKPPVLGMKVARGQTLASFLPRIAGSDAATLDSEVTAARAESEAAAARLARAERLIAERAISEREVDEARAAERIARARLDGATARLELLRAGAAGGSARGAVPIRSPIAGTLVASEVTSGQNVQDGDLLFVVIDVERVWLEAKVFEPDIPKVADARSAWFTVEGHDAVFDVGERGGKLVTVGHLVDAASRTVPVIFEVGNGDEKLRIGQFADVTIAAGAPVRGVAIPESAIVDEGGKPIAYVQAHGEAFHRRPLTIGFRSRGLALVKDGIAEGEYVVTTGAYEIRLSSATGAVPAHGHAH